MPFFNIIVHHITSENAPLVNTAVKLDSSCPTVSSRTLASLIREEIRRKKPHFVYSDCDFKLLETGDGVDIVTFLGEPFSEWGDFVASSVSKRNAIIAVIDPPLVDSNSEDENGGDILPVRKVEGAHKFNDVDNELNAQNVEEQKTKTNNFTIKIEEETSDDDTINLVKVQCNKEESLKDSKCEVKRIDGSEENERSNMEDRRVRNGRIGRKEEIDVDTYDNMLGNKRKGVSRCEDEAGTSKTTEEEREDLTPSKKRKVVAHTNEPGLSITPLRKRRIHVKGIFKSCTEEQIRQYFTKWGKVDHCEINFIGNDPESARITFSTEEAKEACMAQNLCQDLVYFEQDKLLKVKGIPKSATNAEVRQYLDQLENVTDWSRNKGKRGATIKFATNEARETCIEKNGAISIIPFPTILYHQKKRLRIPEIIVIIPNAARNEKIEALFRSFGKINYYNRCDTTHATIGFATSKAREACIANSKVVSNGPPLVIRDCRRNVQVAQTKKNTSSKKHTHYTWKKGKKINISHLSKDQGKIK